MAATVAEAQIFWWNLENYFDTADDADTADESFTPGGEHHWTKRRFTGKRNLIAKTIIASSALFDGHLPAIVGLCEVENGYVLKTLTEDTPLAKAGYRVLHRDGPDPRGIDVALLYDPVRAKLLSVEYITIKEFATREILYAAMAISPPSGTAGQARSADTLHVFVNHWPSKYSGAKVSEQKRRAVGGVLLAVLDSLKCTNPDAAILLMGDFNATAAEESVAGLCRAAGLKDISPREGGSIKFKGKWELIDLMLASDSAASKLATAEVFSPDFLLEEDKAFLGRKPRRTNVGPRYNGGASDHLPLAVRILPRE